MDSAPEGRFEPFCACGVTNRGLVGGKCIDCRAGEPEGRLSPRPGEPDVPAHIARRLVEAERARVLAIIEATPPRLARDGNLIDADTLVAMIRREDGLPTCGKCGLPLHTSDECPSIQPASEETFGPRRYARTLQRLGATSAVTETWVETWSGVKGDPWVRVDEATEGRVAP